MSFAESPSISSPASTTPSIPSFHTTVRSTMEVVDFGDEFMATLSEEGVVVHGLGASRQAAEARARELLVKYRKLCP